MKIIGFSEAQQLADPFRLELLRSVRHWLDALEVHPGLLDYCASSSQLSVHLSVTLNCLVAKSFICHRCASSTRSTNN